MPEFAYSLAVWQVALLGLSVSGALALITWAISCVRADVSLVDRIWGVLIAGAALVYFSLLPAVSLRAALMLALLLLWAARLSLFITLRNWRHGEDRRYQAIRARNQPHFAFKSLYLVFGLQAVLSWVVSAPLFFGLTGAQSLNGLDGLGIALTSFGIVFEAVGDHQMSRFKASRSGANQVMDRGLWRYTRHPNYFGEACVWWGFGLMAVGGAGWLGLWSWISPALMTVLLRKVSGVQLLEKDLFHRHAGYRDYMRRTPAFFPGRPRRDPI